MAQPNAPELQSSGLVLIKVILEKINKNFSEIKK